MNNERFVGRGGLNLFTGYSATVNKGADIALYKSEYAALGVSKFLLVEKTENTKSNKSDFKKCCKYKVNFHSLKPPEKLKEHLFFTVILL